MKRIFKKICILLLAALITVGVTVKLFFALIPHVEFGFSRELPEAEKNLRQEFVSAALNWLGTQEGDPFHKEILDIYNSHEPLAQGYPVTPEDNWCAAFVSTIAISRELTDLIPTECGCQRQIALFDELGCWQENDTYLPLPGDIIYYDWDARTLGDSTGWSDHVGIVMGTWGPVIQVIEGNKDDCVSIRYILQGDPRIRGFGLPDYAAKA